MTVMPYQAAPQPAYYTPNGLAVASAVTQARRKVQGPSILVHAPQKRGKSSMADSGPRPVLILDVETASFWTPSRKIYWEPKRETCPQADGSWDSCIVIIHDYDDLWWLLDFLNKGAHPFNSVSLDSVTTILQRVMMNLAGIRKMTQDQWGILLRQVTGLVWGYRDLLTHPWRPVWSVTFVCGTHWHDKTGKWRPLLMGQSQDVVPYTPDIEGWIEIGQDGFTRQLLIGPQPYIETGNRLWGRLPDSLNLGYPGVLPGWTVETMAAEVIKSQLQ